jgi:hypothetical protein
MRSKRLRRERAVSSGIATVFMVAVVVLLGATMSVAFGAAVNTQPPAPATTFEYQKFEDGTDDGHDMVEMTLTGGQSLEAKQLLLVASEPVDLGAPPDTFWEEGETTGEKLTEGDDQIGIGDTWEAGESIHFSKHGELEGITVRLVWNPTEVEKDGENGKAPSDVIGEDSYVILRFTVQ